MQRGALLGVCIFLFAKSSALLNVGSGLRSPIRSAMPVRRASLSSVLRPGQWRGGKQLRKDAGSRLQPVRNVVLEPTETEEDGTDTPDDLIWQAPEQWQEKFSNRDRRRGKQQLLTLDGSILRAVTLSAQNPVITPYVPRMTWLIRQWRGTVLPPINGLTWIAMLTAASFATAIRVGVFGTATWHLLAAPDLSHPFMQRLLPLNVLWQQSATLTTFILTFFLGQAYTYWRKSYALCRSLQGRLYDINLMLATHCFRDGSGSYTPAARRTLEDVARYTRILHILFWAGIDESLAPIRSDQGLQRLVERGILLERECFALTTSGATWTPRPTYHQVVISWIMSRTIDARVRETLEFGAGTESVFVNNILQLRSKCNSISDEMAARMPLAYVHLVHVLVDSLLLLAPFALYPQVGAMCVPLCGILTLFFRGLLELSKSFLDPFGNEGVMHDGGEDYETDSGNEGVRIQTDTLISEVNAQSNRWWRGAETLPFDTLQSEIAAKGEIFNGRLAGAGLEPPKPLDPDDCEVPEEDSGDSLWNFFEGA